MAKRKIDGVLLLDKPFGFSSNGALSKCRWLLQAEKGGHTGVLDPFATGLLPLCFGEATKFAQRMLDADKGYRATITFGQVSTTLDGEGEISDSGVPPVDLAQIAPVLQQFLGSIVQTPPMYSALKVDGKPLYEYAREGVVLERKSRSITIYELTVVSYQAPVLVVDVLCSKGTYIRVLAEDLGRALGCGAYLSGLRRTLTGGFKLEDAITLDEYIELAMPEREAKLLPAEQLIAELPSFVLNPAQTALMKNGMPILDAIHPPLGELRLYGSGEKLDNPMFIGLGEVGADGVLRPKRLLSTHVA
ncbi:MULTISPECIES: tRNA pseudouridine(55) synthase TruB [Deefgea]|uniref:tRNA pseudouridine synthase B n=1 Tax=Deefgea chitinilytica TaxID=570276 RepID=A0ABS2CAG5_9NEIS|nr:MULTISPECIES: tRNA pseudouridine(55) synthase TruB [Deefgea]MBM5570366.1 tRNA pseudouridine(55) synthase TruB [Deefgea chitinilytica]MBM9887595.1 tRNA pseudouridine(55) synthase TruB [Deefgea sp. CFH1-16]